MADLTNFYELAERGAVEHNADEVTRDNGNKLVTIFNIKKKEGGGLELGDMRAVIADNENIHGNLEHGDSPQALAVELMKAGAKGEFTIDDGKISGKAIGGAPPVVRVVADPAASVEFDTTTMVVNDVKEFTAKQDFGYASDVAIATAQADVPVGGAFNLADVAKDIDVLNNSIGQIKKTAAGFEIHKKPLAIDPVTLRTCATAGELAGILNNNVTINDDPDNVDSIRTFKGGRRARSKSAKRKSKRGGRRRKRKSAKRKH